MQKKRILIIILLIITAGVVALVYLRGDISRKIYEKEGQALAGRLPEKLASKYGEELHYTLDKFWSCYKDGIVSQNDLTDVIERVRELRAKPEIKDLDVFNLIGYVSRMYTDAIRKKQEREQLEEMQDTEPPAEAVETGG